ncbi:MAG TPA: FtsX-like permease family protein [Deltaproteobacteria bacterium]|nr:FtsX-like permease family protein [Deltaproteobacteria bacterium]
MEGFLLKSKTGRIFMDALKALRANKLRTTLAVLGVIVGVASVISMVAVGKRGESRLLAEIQKLGTNTLIVNAGNTPFLGRRRRSADRVTTLTVADAIAIKNKVPGVLAVSSYEKKGIRARFFRTIINTTMSGVTPAYFDIMGIEIEKGHIFTSSDIKRLKRVAVLGKTASKNFGGDEKVLGRMIKLRNVPFRVIGIKKKRGVNAFGNDQDNQIFVPITTMLKRAIHKRHIDTILVQVESEKNLEEVKEKIQILLRSRHRLFRTGKPDDFTVSTMSELLSKKEKATRMFRILITSVASISLIVAGIGIMAVMLISIQERTMEIGLRRAVGATKHDLLVQFLLESALLGLAGGATGAFAGLAIAWSVRATNKYPFPLPVSFAIVASFFAILISLFFGVFPAKKAANLSPATALTKE